MNTIKILKVIGNVVLSLGIIGGIIIIFTKVPVVSMYYTSEEYSITNIIYGISSILGSTFIWTFCNWLSEILHNSYQMLERFNLLSLKLEDEKSNLVEKNDDELPQL